MTISDLEVDPREDKLPRWVREKLHALRRITMEARAELSAFKHGAEPTPFFLQGFGSGRDDQPFYVPEHFGGLKFGKPNDYHKSINLNAERDGWLRISGGGAIAVQPSSSNVIFVKVRDD
jgi:hypothetical protein